MRGKGTAVGGPRGHQVVFWDVLGSGFEEAIHRRRPGALHRLAFKAASHVDVDRLHSELKSIGATIVSPPREYPEYTPPGYYALFFKDPEGIKYEIMCITHHAA